MMFREAWRLAQSERDDDLLRQVWLAENEMDARVAYRAALRGISLPVPAAGVGK